MSKILKYLSKYVPMIVGCAILLFTQAMCDLALPDLMSKIVSEGIAVSDMDVVYRYGVEMLIYSFVCSLCAVGAGYLGARVGSGFARNLRRAVFRKVSSFSNNEFNKFSVASLITRSTNDITQVQMFTVMFLRLAMFAPIMGIGGVIKAIQKGNGMSDLAIVIIIAVVTLVILLGGLLLIVHPRFTKLQKQVDKLNLTAREALNGMTVIRAFNTVEAEEARYDGVNKDLTKMALFVNRVMGLMNPIINLIMNGVSIAVIWVASRSAGNIVEVANMMAFLQYAMHIIMSFMFVSMAFMMFPRANVSANRLGEIVQTEVSIFDHEGAIEAKDMEGVVRFENVSFTYSEGEAPAIEDISFVAEPGKVTAIIGGTGSGKSTLINLLPRLYDVTEGRVLIDGQDVRGFTLSSLRENIGFVPQKNVLFSGTVESNLKMGVPDADEASLDDAIDVAQAREIVSAHRDGIKREIAQGGSNVSGGQKQRLSIARALVKKCPIYVFDDSFSALDFKTDAALRRALKERTEKSTVIIVAQRVGTIMSADQILVLDDGKLVGKGTHEELMKTCEVYADIAKSQLSEEDLKR